MTWCSHCPQADLNPFTLNPRLDLQLIGHPRNAINYRTKLRTRLSDIYNYRSMTCRQKYGKCTLRYDYFLELRHVYDFRFDFLVQAHGKTETHNYSKLLDIII